MILRVPLISVAVLTVCLGNTAGAAPLELSDSGGEATTDVLPVPETAATPVNEGRILKIIPDYQTVHDSSHAVAPLSGREKWQLALREAADPFNLGNALLTAGFSQHKNQTPSYGEGWANYGKRFGAAAADFGTQSVLSAGVFATLLHQDPRYFRKGPEARISARVLYAVSRLFVCRNDAGKPAFNASNLLGMSTGIALSNLYYPSASRTGTVMAGRVQTSLFGGVTGNLLSEFWPDLQQKFFHKKQKPHAVAP
jgi:hypothetical protein